MKTKNHDPYDDHADAAMACIEATERIEVLKSELSEAEANLLSANAVYAAAHDSLKTFERKYPHA